MAVQRARVETAKAGTTDAVDEAAILPQPKSYACRAPNQTNSFAVIGSLPPPTSPPTHTLAFHSDHPRNGHLYCCALHPHTFSSHNRKTWGRPSAWLN